MVYGSLIIKCGMQLYTKPQTLLVLMLKFRKWLLIYPVLKLIHVGKREPRRILNTVSALWWPDIVWFYPQLVEYVAVYGWNMWPYSMYWDSLDNNLVTLWSTKRHMFKTVLKTVICPTSQGKPMRGALNFYSTITFDMIHAKLLLTHKKMFTSISTSPPGQNGRHVADDIFRCIFVNEKLCILITISLKFVTKGPIDNNLALV